MLTIQEIATLQPGQLPAIILLAGEDSGQYSLLKESLFQQLGFDPADLTYAYFDLSQTPYEEAALDLESMPFFSDQKIVIFDQFADLTTAKKAYLDDKALKNFEDYINNPVETTRLVICAPGKLDGKRRLVKLLKKTALTLDASPVKEGDLRNYMRVSLDQAGLDLSSAVLEQFLEKSQFDFATAVKNTQLLAQVKGGGKVSAADIQEILPRSLQDDIFHLTSYLMAKKIDQARLLTQDLVLQGQDEIKLLAVMTGQFRTFLQVALLAKMGKSEQQMVSILSDALGRKVNPYQIKFALRDSRKLKSDQLQAILRLLIETDYQMKTGAYDKGYLFDLVLLKIVNL